MYKTNAHLKKCRQKENCQYTCTKHTRIFRNVGKKKSSIFMYKTNTHLKATYPACKHNRVQIFQFCKMFFTIKLPTLVNVITFKSCIQLTNSKRVLWKYFYYI